MSDEIRIDWGSAEVENGRLTVPFTGTPTTDFKAQVADVIERLRDGGGWGEIKVSKSKLRVATCRGAESPADVRRLRTASEGAEARPAARSSRARRPAGRNANWPPTRTSRSSGSERSEADEGTTATFRGFAD